MRATVAMILMLTLTWSSFPSATQTKPLEGEQQPSRAPDTRTAPDWPYIGGPTGAVEHVTISTLDHDYRSIEAFMLTPLTYANGMLTIRIRIDNLSACELKLPSHRVMGAIGGGLPPDRWSFDLLAPPRPADYVSVWFRPAAEEENRRIPPFGSKIIAIEAPACAQAAGFGIALLMHRSAFEFRYHGPNKDENGAAWEDVCASQIFRARFTPDGAVHVPLDEESSE